MRILSYQTFIIIFLVTTFKVNAKNISPYINQVQKFSKYQFEASGIINSTLSSSDQSNGYSLSLLPDNFSKNYLKNSNNIGFDNQVFIKSAIKLKEQNYIGATAKFELNYNTSSKNQKPNLDQIFLYHNSEYGKFEFGNIQPVNQKLKYGPSRFASGAGGINGKYLEYINLPTILNNNQICSANILNPNCQNIQYPRFILLAQSPVGHGGYAKGFYSRDVDNKYSQSELSNFNKYNFRTLKDDSFEGLEDALKINYYSPKINELQFGISYAPNSTNQGFTAKTAPDSNDTKLKDIFSFGINYVNDFDNLNLSLSSTAEYAKTVNYSSIRRNDLLSFDFGGSVSYFGFTLGASYGYWGKSLSAKNDTYKNNKDSYYYSSGIAYQIGPIRSSITSINSNFQENRYQALSFGIDYKIKKNLFTYLEMTSFKFDVNRINYIDSYNQIRVANSSDNIQNNSGKVFLTGIYYIF